MNKKKIPGKLLSLLLVLILLVTMTAPAYAGKGGGTTPAPLTITPLSTMTFQTNVNEQVTFSLTATGKVGTNITWSATPAGLAPSGPATTSNASTITYTYPSATAGTYQFTITAKEGKTTAKKTVTITVTAAPVNELNYLVLGDSIAAGTDNAGIRKAIDKLIASNSSLLGLLGDVQDLTAHPEKYVTGNDYRYTYQFRDFLQLQTGKTVKLTDLSVPGYTTADLLTQVSANTAAIQSANVITISIGGNDILAAGAAYGFSTIDTSQFDAIKATVSSNLEATIAFIRDNNSNAKIILMNFLNLYNPYEMPLSGDASLYDQADPFLTDIGNIFAGIAANHNVILADTYSLFEAVNDGSPVISTDNTLAKASLLNPPYNMGTTPLSNFPARFITNSASTVVQAPHLAWGGYMTEWPMITSAPDITQYTPASGVTVDLYTHFYNPTHYVFGHDETTSDLIKIIKAKYFWEWPFLRTTVLANISPFEKWRDVHCTSLGHSLIAQAHIEAWEAATTGTGTP